MEIVDTFFFFSSCFLPPYLCAFWLLKLHSSLFHPQAALNISFTNFLKYCFKSGRVIFFAELGSFWLTGPPPKKAEMSGSRLPTLEGLVRLMETARQGL